MPCDYRRYPRDWKRIRAEILERASHRCERCGVDNYAVIARERAGAQRMTRIVLTVAHLDHDVENNAPSNLAALCQRCHLAHDQQLHLDHARRTRDRRRGQADLLDETMIAAPHPKGDHPCR